MTGRSLLAALVGTVIVGAAVRLLPFIGTDFPLNDGGLFLAMTRELQATGYAIPATTGYNDLDIPFVYPPLAFYVAAVVNDVTGASLFDLFRVLPLLFSIATMPAFFLVARQLLGPVEASVATLAFALLPRSWEWMVLGGGITRSLGFLLALLAIAAALRMYRAPTAGWIAAMGVAAGLTALAHPQAAVFMAVSLALLWVGISRSWGGMRGLLIAAVVGVAVISPWAVPMLMRHGPEPFLSARTTGGGFVLGLILFLKLRFTGAPFMDVLGIIGFAGFAVALAQRRWLAPAWLVVILLVDSRGGATYAMAPLAMLVGIGVVAGVRAMGTRFDARRPLGSAWANRGLAVGSTAILVMAIATNQGVTVKDDSVLLPVSTEQRAAMDWASRELPEAASVAVVTGADHWEKDRVSEWFPVLGERHSVATFQGYEWLGMDRWTAQARAFDLLQECSRGTADCLTDWIAATDRPVDYVFVPKGSTSGPQAPSDCCPALRATLRTSAEIVYDGPGASIARMGEQAASRTRRSVAASLRPA